MGPSHPCCWHSSTYKGYKTLFSPVWLFPFRTWNPGHVTRHHPCSGPKASCAATEQCQQEANTAGILRAKSAFSPWSFFFSLCKGSWKYTCKSQRSSAVPGAPSKDVATAATDPRHHCHLVPIPPLTSKEVTQPHSPASPPCGPCSSALLCSEKHAARGKNPSHLQ